MVKHVHVKLNEDPAEEILRLVWLFRLNFLGQETDSVPVGPREA